mmetsp:Transcript_19797/g.29642  ORF Transcript_19797/g.29642 Transcript_19797/m.29642 type:complete len:83 (-) Transcript_19797:116-364(-)
MNIQGDEVVEVGWETKEVKAEDDVVGESMDEEEIHGEPGEEGRKHEEMKVTVFVRMAIIDPGVQAQVQVKYKNKNKNKNKYS